MKRAEQEGREGSAGKPKGENERGSTGKVEKRGREKENRRRKGGRLMKSSERERERERKAGKPVEKERSAMRAERE